MVTIPAFCLTCGRVFPSQMFGFAPGARVRIHAMGNIETCPYCGGMAQTADGVFEVTGDILRVVSAPQITRDMLAALSVVVRRAFQENNPPEEVAQEVEKIDPSFGSLIRRSAMGGSFLVVLILLLWTIRSCVSVNVNVNVNVDLDVNQLFDQWINTPPPPVMAPPEPPAKAPEPPAPETNLENPRTI
jgi:hypothetical protein